MPIDILHAKQQFKEYIKKYKDTILGYQSLKSKNIANDVSNTKKTNVIKDKTNTFIIKINILPHQYCLVI